uniref:Ethanolaminephosphotransferase 1 n=1 Tax=Caenorhabditis japonica TaxID=281687 RepID=A0A8R1DN16_CAEJA
MGFVKQEKHPLEYEYMQEEHLKGFDSYKYNCVDNSPLSVYVSHPFWNWLVEFYPRTWVPNVLTLTGWGFVMAGFFLESYLDYGIERNSEGSTDPIPNWFWFVAALCTFLGHTLDGTDGKQSRRIGASGPTGELFDHGLDSWSTVPFTITIFSIFGRGRFSISTIELLCVLISTQIVFFTTHWEKYNTGVMFLSWGYDVSQFGLVFVYLWTYIVGYKWFHFDMFGGIVNFATVFEIGFYICCILSLIASAYNVHKTEKLKQSSLLAGVRPVWPVLVLFASCIFWAVKSPTNVIDEDPRFFFFCMGTVFSNITCRLIIAQMASTVCDIYNLTLGIYLTSIALSFYSPLHEILILRVSTLIILALHIHYGVCVVRQLCRHFNIYAFDVSYLKDRKK